MDYDPGKRSAVTIASYTPVESRRVLFSGAPITFARGEPRPPNLVRPMGTSGCASSEIKMLLERAERVWRRRGTVEDGS